MANTRLIEEYIRDSGYKLRHVARALNISESALHSKLQGQTQFKLNEAENLSAMLGMTMSERDACFFDTQNRYERSLAPAGLWPAAVGAVAGEPSVGKGH